MSYFAEIDANQVVQRVIVADSAEWCADHLGGTWVETADPYSDEPQAVTYCGPGFGYADNLPEKFAPVWDATAATTPNENGTYRFNGGEVVWHNGRLWRNVTQGVPNVWEPGVSGWHDSPEVGLPQWVQPTGAHDAYPLGAEVTHNGQDWRSDHAANVWEPGVFGWSPID